MSNNDGAAAAQCMAVGEELSRAMVELAHLRKALEKIASMTDQDMLEPEWVKVARAALGEKE